MSRFLTLIIVALVSAVPVYAGQVYGSLKEDGRSSCGLLAQSELP